MDKFKNYRFPLRYIERENLAVTKEMIVPTEYGVNNIFKSEVAISFPELLNDRFGYESKEFAKWAVEVLNREYALLQGQENALEINKTEIVNSGYLDEKLDKFGFSTRVTNFFNNNKIKTVNDLKKYTKTELVSMKGFGVNSLNEVVDKMKEIGVELNV